MSLESRFQELTATWRETSSGSSFLSVICTDNESYRAIIRLGRLVVPLIMEDLKKGPDHWFLALEAITGAKLSIPDESAGRLREITDIWLKWWAENEPTWRRKDQELYALRWETGTFHDFHPSKLAMSLCGTPPYHRVRVTPDPEGEYWAWHDFAKDTYNYTNRNQNGVSICFPYGPEVETKFGRGEMIRVRVEDLGVDAKE